MARSKPKFKLYWIETDDHGEDWFVMARNAYAARRHFEAVEGYDRGDSRATEVLILGEEGRTGWPTLEELVALGFEVLRAKTPRVLVYNGVRYAEGVMEYSLRVHDDNLLESMGKGRPNGTVREEVQ